MYYTVFFITSVDFPGSSQSIISSGKRFLSSGQPSNGCSNLDDNKDFDCDYDNDDLD
jgi:hypothetical protein